MEKATKPLDTKLVSEIKGLFYVPSYQRGYRWGAEEVERLLDDIYGLIDYENGRGYCLQPIVVINDGERYELVDGQQRLTTIYLIYMYLHNAFSGSFAKPEFSLEYENRKGSQQFLETIDLSKETEYIDYWFMCQAYKTIDAWFASKDKQMAAKKILDFFKSKVMVIWYEIDVNDSADGTDAISLFTRLNIGKIPLTSAELVKAMFLSRESETELEQQKQQEIALQWDNIERELHNESLWYFLTNNENRHYQTRIDLVLDLISGKDKNDKDQYATFFYFDEEKKSAPKGQDWRTQIWREIQHTFLVLKDWYENHNFYHKIGFLIASGEVSLRDIYELSLNKTKSDFESALDSKIKQLVTIGKNYGELSYETNYKEISRLILLFNIESVRSLDNAAQRFPFDKYKGSDGSGVVWSLEHIHAQQSEGLKDRKQWNAWIESHLDVLKRVKADTELISRMEEFSAKENSVRDDFLELQNKAVEALSEAGGVEYKHTIANLALLNTRDNAALNNAVFEVKRDLIIEMDKAGQFIPFCTRMVFLKYYTPSEGNQLHFWGHKDREAYVAAIYKKLEKYMDEPILLEKEEA